MSQGVHALWGVKQVRGGENKLFTGFKRTNRKSYMVFRLTPRSMTLDDLELL